MSISSMRSTSIAAIASATFSIAIPAPSIVRSRPTRRARRETTNGGRRPTARRSSGRPSQGKPNAVRVLTERGAGARTPDDMQRAERIVDVPAVGVLGPSRARQGRPSDARPRGAAHPRAGSVDRPRQHLHRDRVRRSAGGRAHPRRAAGSRASRAAAPAAGRPSCIWPTRGSRTRRRSSMLWRSHGCCSTTARTRTTSTWPATRVTRSSPAWPERANRIRRGSRTRRRCSSCCSSAAPSRSTFRSSTTRISAATFSGGSSSSTNTPIDTARGRAWKDPDWAMFDMGAYGSGARFLLETAVKKRNIRLAEWVLAHGANPNAAPGARQALSQAQSVRTGPDGRPSGDGGSPGAPWRRALRSGPRRATSGSSDACFRLDRDDARRLWLAHPEYLQSPAAMFEAARRDRPDVLALLLDLGAPLEIAGPDRQTRAARGCRQQCPPRRRSSSSTAERKSIHASRATTATPIGWAAHGDKIEMVNFLSRHSRDIWTLCFRGYVDRVREILTEDPGRARVVSRRRHHSALVAAG